MINIIFSSVSVIGIVLSSDQIDAISIADFFPPNWRVDFFAFLPAKSREDYLLNCVGEWRPDELDKNYSIRLSVAGACGWPRVGRAQVGWVTARRIG